MYKILIPPDSDSGKRRNSGCEQQRHADRGGRRAVAETLTQQDSMADGSRIDVANPEIRTHRTSDEETRNSSSAGLALLGRHLVIAYTRKQKIIARSSAEAKLYAAALGASEPKSVESMMRDLGFAVMPVLKQENTFHTDMESEK